MSLSTPQLDPTRPRRNPVYGDELEALQNYNHMDRPAQVSHLRGPQATLPDMIDVSDSSAPNEQPKSTYNPVQAPAKTTTTSRGPQAILPDLIDLSDSSAPKIQSKCTSKLVQKFATSTATTRGPQTIQHIKKDNTSVPAKGQPKGVDKSVQVQEAKNNSPAPLSQPQRTATTRREGRWKTDTAVRNQPATTDNPRQTHPLADAFLYIRRSEANDTADDQSMTTVKPRQLFTSNSSVASFVTDDKTVRAKKKANANLGDVASQVNLGDMYKQGLVVKQDYEMALKWYTKAASSGHSGAQYQLGLLYEHGDGCAKSDVIAFQWFLKSAQQGYPTARYVVADWYEKGRGCLKDGPKSLEYYLMAAEQGHVNAQLRLGWMHTNGNGVPKDESKALIWNLKAAEQGNRRGQTLVAEAYEYGRGAPKNDNLALKWYIKLAEKWGGGARDKVAQFYREGRGRGGDSQDDRQAKNIHDEVSEDQKKAKVNLDSLEKNKSDTPSPLPPPTLIPPVPSYLAASSSKDGYEYSSTNSYYPSQPPPPVYPPPGLTPRPYSSQPVYPYAPQPHPPTIYPFASQPVYQHPLTTSYRPQPPYPTYNDPYLHPYGSPPPFGPSQPLFLPAPPQIGTVIVAVPQHHNGTPSPYAFPPAFGFPHIHPYP